MEGSVQSLRSLISVQEKEKKGSRQAQGNRERENNEQSVIQRDDVKVENNFQDWKKTSIFNHFNYFNFILNYLK